MLPAAIILASINLTPEQWLAYSQSDKDRFINAWFQQQNTSGTSGQRTAIVVALDEFARCATGAARPAGVARWDEATQSYRDDTTTEIYGDTDGGVSWPTGTGNSGSSGSSGGSNGSGSSGNSGGNSQSGGLDPTTNRGSQFWQSVATGAFGVANTIFNSLNSNDQARLRLEAQNSLQRTQLQYDNARSNQERAFYGQQLDFMRQLAARGSSTAGYIALGVAGIAVLGGVLYATSRRKPKQNPYHRRRYSRAA